MEGKQGRAAGFRRGSLLAARARGARELEEIEVNLLVGLGGVRDSRRRLDGNGQGAEAEGIDDDGAPVRDWQRGGAGELRWSKAKLLGWCCRSKPTGE